MNINIKIIKSTKKQQQNCINYKQKINTTTKGNDMKNSVSTTTKGKSNEDKEKNTGTEMVKPKIFNLSSKTFRYQSNILLRGLKFTPTPKRNNMNLNLTYKITRADCDLLSFSKTKKQTILRTFFKNNLPLPHLEIGIEI